ncbi:hypothetical protein JYU34_018661 [Plutella xylostella]|uniref:Strictosidine synthase conserved region domain-containing protein n=1 Tax=Plutella xylostella TaxID=51655 RepID=A0ABQ7PY39_PLUXY|nr:hypothetical protein JYU34_018661 [Plutella xylostella]
MAGPPSTKITMGFIFGLIKRIIRWSLYLALVAAAIVLIPNLPPYTDFSVIPLEPTQPREGPLAPNEALNNAQKLYNGKLLGPEAFQLYDGEVYTSLATGEIVKLSPGGHVTFVTKVGQPCTGLLDEEKCGRPLDFEIDEKQKKLIIADAYHGIWRVDLKTDKKELLVSPRVEIEGRVPRLFNGIALDRDGDFFWTDSSSDFTLKDGAISLLTDPSGRLFHYSAAKNSSRVLVQNLWCANGLAVSPDRQFVVVAETFASRIVKHYIDGPNKGKTEEFVAGLPGTPDNVRSLPDGSGILVGLYTVPDAAHPLLTRTLAATPAARKLLARVQRLAELPFEFLNQHFPNVVFQEIVHNIGHFKTVGGLLPPTSGLIQIDWNGKIVASYYNTDKSVVSISDAIVVGDQLYLGCPYVQQYIGAVPAPEGLKKAFASVQKAPKTEAPKPKVETKPKEQPKVEKPVVKEAPKPAAAKPQAKPVETPKPTPKPVETKPKAEAKPSQPPKQEKPATPPPKKVETTTPPPKKEEKVTTPPKPTKPVEKAAPTPAPKQAEKPAAAPKQAAPKPAAAPTPKPAATKPAEKQQEKPKSVPKPAEPKEDKAKKSPEPEKKSKSKDKKVPDEIPIQEYIPVDTAKPGKEPLKVIKKEGPTEIPNHL